MKNLETFIHKCLVVNVLAKILSLLSFPTPLLSLSPVQIPPPPICQAAARGGGGPPGHGAGATQLSITKTKPVQAPLSSDSAAHHQAPSPTGSGGLILGTPLLYTYAFLKSNQKEG